MSYIDDLNIIYLSLPRAILDEIGDNEDVSDKPEVRNKWVNTIKYIAKNLDNKDLIFLSLTERRQAINRIVFNMLVKENSELAQIDIGKLFKLIGHIVDDTKPSQKDKADYMKLLEHKDFIIAKRNFFLSPNNAVVTAVFSEMTFQELSNLERDWTFLNSLNKWVNLEPKNENNKNFFTAFRGNSSLWVFSLEIDIVRKIATGAGSYWRSKGDKYKAFFADLKAYILQYMQEDGYCEFISEGLGEELKAYNIEAISQIIERIQQLTYSQISTKTVAKTRKREEVDYIPQANSIEVMHINHALVQVPKLNEARLNTKNTEIIKINGEKFFTYNQNGIQFAINISGIENALAAKNNISKWFHYILNKCYQNYDINSDKWKATEFYITPEEILAENWYLSTNSNVIAGFYKVQKTLFNIPLYEIQLGQTKKDKSTANPDLDNTTILAATPRKMFSELKIVKDRGRDFIKIIPDTYANWKAIFQQITYLPDYAYSLSPQAFQMVLFFASHARINAQDLLKKQKFEFYYSSLANRLGLPAWKNTKDIKGKTLDVLAEAVREIQAAESQNKGKKDYWQVESDPITKPYKQCYENGKVYVCFAAHYAKKIGKVATAQKKAQGISK